MYCYSPAQYEAMKAVNKEMIQFYWDIGKRITEKQQALGWGKSVAETLSKDLQKEFFVFVDLVRVICEQSPNFIQNIAQFYFPTIGRRNKKFGWTKDVLIHKIEAKVFEKYLLGQTNFDKMLPDNIKDQAILAVKDDYTFDFLGLDEEHSELELEQALIKNIRSFLIEFGTDFTFAGNQYCIELEGEEYFIDLLLYWKYRLN